MMASMVKNYGIARCTSITSKSLIKESKNVFTFEIISVINQRESIVYECHFDNTKMIKFILVCPKAINDIPYAFSMG